MALCARFGEAAGFNEINMNVGCPSARVQSGRFGACLMAEPELVSDCFSAMASTVRIPVTIKCRIGIDDRDSYEDLESFVTTLVEGGCRTFIVHARKAWLTGLSPKQNREVPPLHYNIVYRLKQNYSDLEIIVNGGICSIEAARSHLEHVDGVMVGREAYQNPFSLADVDGELFGIKTPSLTRWQVLDQYKSYIASEIESGTQLKHMSRHMLGLFAGQVGARAWRRYLSEHAVRHGAGLEVIEAAERIVRQKMQHAA
jgi:tRNA-dihydrouridine synthase A